MKYNIVFHVEAQDEVIDAARYIAARTDGVTAERWYSGLVAAASTFSEMPERCSTAPEDEYVSGAKLRQLIYQSHRLIFTVDNNAVQILHVRHRARDAVSGPETRFQDDAPTNLQTSLSDEQRLEKLDIDRERSPESDVEL